MKVSEEAVKRLVLDYLEKQGPIPAASEPEKLAFEYLDSGHIDSMGLVAMIAEFEKTLNVRLEPEQMQSEEFRTVGGLIGILQRLAQ